MINNLKAAKRETTTKGQLNILRTKGMIPAVLYGGKSPNLKLSIEEKFVKDVLNSENFSSLTQSLWQQASTSTGQTLLPAFVFFKIPAIIFYKRF